MHITFSVERPRLRDILAQSLEDLSASSPVLNSLRPWGDTAQPSPVDLLRTLDSASLHPVQSAVAETPGELPFDSWDSLAAQSLNVRLRTTLSALRSDEGYALQFPDFTITVGQSPGDRLGELAAKNDAVIESPDDELREILFHLVGRGAISLSAEVPA
jgi:hypothetical protein